MKDDWEEEWLADNWTDEDEAEFLIGFKERWLKDHGADFPNSTVLA